MKEAESTLKTAVAALVAAVVLVLCAPQLGRGAGVTIITHGLNGNVTDWIIPMANQIPGYDLFPGSSYSCYKITVTDSVSESRIGGVSPLVSDSGEIIIKLD